MKCWNCNTELISESENPLEINADAEHIIPMSLGGRMKSKKLICRKCNNTAGLEIDKELEKQFLPFSSMLDVKARSEKFYIAYDGETGERRLMPPGMRGSFQLITQSKDREPFVNFARDFKELKNKRKAIQKQWEKKGWKFDFSELDPVIKGPMKVTNMDKPGEFFFGGFLFWQGILKIAVNYFIFNGGNAQEVQEIIDAINGRLEYSINDFAKFYYPDLFRIQSEQTEENDDILHRLIIDGDPHTGILYCRIELFKFCKVLVVLSTNYNGSRIKNSYSYDLIKEKEVQVPIDELNKNPDFYRVFPALRMGANSKEMLSQLNNVLRIITDRQEEIRAKR